MKVFLTDAAKSDLDAIVDHIAADAPRRALTFADELLDCCLGLAEAPTAFPIAPRYARAGVRRRIHGRYLIFYRVAENRIEVLHIVHGARDWESFLRVITDD